MTAGATVLPTLTLAVIGRQYLVCLGLQSVFQRSKNIRIVMRQYQQITPDLLLAEKRPDAFMLELETNRDAIDTTDRFGNRRRQVRSCC